MIFNNIHSYYAKDETNDFALIIATNCILLLLLLLSLSLL